MSAIAKRGKRALVFDGDASQYFVAGLTAKPCSLCGEFQDIEKPPRVFIRVREKLAHGTREVAFLCPDCIARAVLQVERLQHWDDVSPAVRAALTRQLARRRRLTRRRP